MIKIIQSYQRILVSVLFCLLSTQTNNALAATELTNINSGWFTAAGVHNELNKNYAASQSGGTLEYPEKYRNFFTFDISTIDVDNADNATFKIFTYEITTPGLFTLYDVSTPASELSQTYALTSGAHSIYSDLGTGEVYGSIALHPSDSYTFATIALNSNFISALKSANSTISIGGTFVASPSIYDTYLAFGWSDFTVDNVVYISAVPEPSNKYLLAIGLLFVIGAATKRRLTS